MAFPVPFVRRFPGLLRPHCGIRLLVTLVLGSAAFAAAPDNPPPWHAAPPPEYVVRRVKAPLPPPSSLETAWQSPAWTHAATLDVDRFHAKPDPLYPRTQARVLYDDAGLHVFFRVEDRYVRSVITAYQGPVSRDACVEFFLEPDGQRGYLNIEVNAGGTLLMKYHDPRLRPGAEESPPGYRLVLVPWEEAQHVRVHHSLPKVVDPEITTPVVWHVQYFVPFEILESHFGPLRPLPGRQWRANFYKISAANSHPHRATWAPIPPDARAAGFHQPRFFAPIRFE
ncbi:MAG: carbohydrate-binding family 9-like protein [Opitutaceae bacterium]|nr:carbohydrate-binding family 9-like protein [Opitutaceae bacterium]